MINNFLGDSFKLLEIIYQSDGLVAINKPHGLLVHRSGIAKDAKVFALQKLRDQLKRHVFLCHRLDRKTSGVLLFTTEMALNVVIQTAFRERKVNKTYFAIVRGYTDDEGEIDYPIGELGKVKQEAFTKFSTVKRYEIPLPNGKYNTSRFSLVKITPRTGRFHQIRKHFAHLRHPILGDRPHGCNKQNRLWKEHFDMTTMMLHAQSIEFSFKGKSVEISADFSKEWTNVMRILEHYPLL